MNASKIWMLLENQTSQKCFITILIPKMLWASIQNILRSPFNPIAIIWDILKTYEKR